MEFLPRNKDVATKRCRQEANQDIFVNHSWSSKWARWSLAGCKEMDAVFALFMDYAELKVPKRDAGVWVKLAQASQAQTTPLPKVGREREGCVACSGAWAHQPIIGKHKKLRNGRGRHFL
jgi:hypothetical protein